MSHRIRPIFSILPRQRVGLNLGPGVFALLLLVLLNPEPPGMVNAALIVGADDWAPVVAP